MEWLFGGIALSGVSWVIWAVRRMGAYDKWRKSIDISQSLYAHLGWFGDEPQAKVVLPGEAEPKWGRCALVITHKRIAVYTFPDEQPTFTIQPHELQGFWRPQKYADGVNEMWIHAHIGLTWHILQIRLHKSAMQALVRAMKEIGTEEQTKAYRRRRPYIHRGPSLAHPATQNLQGAWELDTPVALYIMPLRLVIFKAKEVQQTIPLGAIQNIAASSAWKGANPTV